MKWWFLIKNTGLIDWLKVLEQFPTSY